MDKFRVIRAGEGQSFYIRVVIFVCSEGLDKETIYFPVCFVKTSHPHV